MAGPWAALNSKCAQMDYRISGKVPLTCCPCHPGLDKPPSAALWLQHGPGVNESLHQQRVRHKSHVSMPDWVLVDAYRPGPSNTLQVWPIRQA